MEAHCTERNHDVKMSKRYISKAPVERHGPQYGGSHEDDETADEPGRRQVRRDRKVCLQNEPMHITEKNNQH